VLSGTVHHTAGVAACGGQVERLLADHLAGGLPAPEVGHDLVRDLDVAEGEPAVAPSSWLALPTIRMSVTSRAVVE
jgi:hypothetical protein